MIAIAVAILGLAAVIGRAFEIAPLTFASGGAAVGMLFCALALLALLNQSGRPIVALGGSILAFCAMGLGALNVGRYFCGLELTDLFSNLQIGGFQPAVFVAMTPSDSVMVTLISLSLLLMNVSIKGFRPAELVSFIVTLASLMTLLGVILKIDAFCMFFACARISPIVGTAFGILSIATLCARPTEGFISLLFSSNAGGVAARRLLPSSLVIPLIVSWLRMTAVHLGFPEELGLTFMVALMMVMFLSLLCWTSWSMEHLDWARQLAVLRAQQSEKRTRMVIQQAIDAFVAVDVNGVIKDWNERAADAFGFRREEVLGKSLFELVVPVRFREGATMGVKHLLMRSEGTIPSKPLEYFAVRKDGSEFPVELSLFPVVIDSERLLCTFARDITERKMIEQRFREFYSTVSHELRSPLTSMGGCIAVVKEMCRDIPDIAHEMFEIAETNLDRLIRLINDMLDVKRIEDGQLKLNLEPLDPVKIVSIAADGLRGSAAAATVELEVVIEDASFFTGDADRIVQVLTNLIANAIKFTEPGGSVIVRVMSSKNPHNLRFLVQDQGAGITSSDIPKLFNKFSQLGEGKSRAGTGLGLAISKAIIEEHGGEIGVESVVGEGTTFWFELPLARRDMLQKEQVTALKLQHLDVDA
jgi:PAS domain S-box-containing protein